MTAPRLLTEGAAADYLSIPLASVRRLEFCRVSLDGRVRYDRAALDRWLDGEGLAPKVGAPTGLASNENQTSGDNALAAFLANHPHVARRRP